MARRDDQAEWRIAVEIGEAVRWSTVSFASEWLGALVGGEMAVPVRWEDPDEAPDGEMIGTVVEIRVVDTDRQKRDGRSSGPHGEPPGGVWEKVPGSGRLTAVNCIEEQRLVQPFRSEHGIEGWIVEIQHV